MTASEIQKIIQLRFDTHKYELFNSYIFNEGWECDFFSIAASGYCYEVEIKISRSDFFADFKKEKHDLFKHVYSGQQWYFKNCGPDRRNGSLICKALSAKFKFYPSSGKYEPDQHRDRLNQYSNWLLNKNIIEYRAACTKIQHIDLQKASCPNRFYYAVPEGLIIKAEVPAYAGLLYIKDGHAVTIKEAPLIHKRKLELHRILAHKFYWETKQLRRWKDEYEYEKKLEKIKKQNESATNSNSSNLG